MGRRVCSTAQGNFPPSLEMKKTHSLVWHAGCAGTCMHRTTLASSKANTAAMSRSHAQRMIKIAIERDTGLPPTERQARARAVIGNIQQCTCYLSNTCVEYFAARASACIQTRANARWAPGTFRMTGNTRRTRPLRVFCLAWPCVDALPRSKALSAHEHDNPRSANKTTGEVATVQTASVVQRWGEQNKRRIVNATRVCRHLDAVRRDLLKEGLVSVLALTWASAIKDNQRAKHSANPKPRWRQSSSSPFATKFLSILHRLTRLTSAHDWLNSEISASWHLGYLVWRCIFLKWIWKTSKLVASLGSKRALAYSP